MTKTVAVLGTGIMGAGMARNLIGAGLDVTVWNRSPDRARAARRRRRADRDGRAPRPSRARTSW